jgi:heme o synthase
VKEIPANLAAVPLPVSGRGTFADYVSLTKPRLNLLVVATSAAGYYLGDAHGSGTATNSGALGIPMALAVVGTALVAGGAAVLNQAAERRTDAMMRRTRCRAIPDGRVTVVDACVFGAALAIVGLGTLLANANALAASLALATLVIYLGIYTPLKRRTSGATLVGAVPGALPPLIGWTASHGTISLGGLALFAIVFLWQIPHFMAIAWMYRDDYKSAGFPMLPVIDPSGGRAGQQAVLYAAALIPISAVPTIAGLTGTAYLYAASVLGLALISLAVRFWSKRTDASARWLFFGSIIYLPLLWVALIANRL